MHLPQDSHIGISQRIGDEAERTLLKDTLTKLLPANVPHGGFIIRTMAEKATERDLARDVEYLTKLWADVLTHSKTVKSGTIIHHDLTLAERVLRDFATEDTQRVFVDSPEAHKAMLEFAARYAPAVTERLRLHQAVRPLFDMYGVEQEIERALHRRVDLKSGGYVIIDQTQVREAVHCESRAIRGDGGVQRFEDCIAMLGQIHIDEIDDDDAAQVTQPKLPRYSLRRFLIGLENSVVKRAHTDESTGIHVNGSQRFGLVDDDIAAALQIYAAMQCALNLLLHAVHVEQRAHGLMQT